MNFLLIACIFEIFHIAFTNVNVISNPLLVVAFFFFFLVLENFACILICFAILPPFNLIPLHNIVLKLNWKNLWLLCFMDINLLYIVFQSQSFLILKFW